MSSIAESLLRATQAKEEGNAAIKAGNFKRACFHYKFVHLFTTTLGSKAKEHGLLLAEAGTGAANDGTVDMFRGSSGPPRPTPAEQESIDALIAAANSNLALGHLKLQRYAQAVQAATIALLYDSANAKALFRRASARFQLGQTDEAHSDCQRVLEIAGDDAAALALMQDIEIKQRAHAERERKAYAKMFA